MALKIDGASIGFDANGIQEALKNINAKVINETCNQMDNEMSGLHEVVDDAWQGNAAEQFKKNMEIDKKTVQDALNDAYDSLEIELKNIMDSMAEADENLVKERSVN